MKMSNSQNHTAMKKAISAIVLYLVCGIIVGMILSPILGISLLNGVILSFAVVCSMVALNGIVMYFGAMVEYLKKTLGV